MIFGCLFCFLISDIFQFCWTSFLDRISSRVLNKAVIVILHILKLILPRIQLLFRTLKMICAVNLCYEYFQVYTRIENWRNSFKYRSSRFNKYEGYFILLYLCFEKLLNILLYFKPELSKMSLVSFITLHTLVLLHAHLLSCTWLFETPWTLAHQAPLFMGFPGKNTGGGCCFLFEGIFLTQRLNPCLLSLMHWQEDSLPLSHWEHTPRYPVVSKHHFLLTCLNWSQTRSM